jgi:hypothetical protein
MIHRVVLSAFMALVVGLPSFPRAHGQGTPSALAQSVLSRFGEPSEVHDWRKGFLYYDYKLANDQVITIVLEGERVVWTGLKVNWGTQVGRRIRLEGVYYGPGKWANYILGDDGQEIYLGEGSRRGVTVPKDLTYGQRIAVTGVIAFSEKWIPPQDNMTGKPEFYYFKDATVEVIASGSPSED